MSLHDTHASYASVPISPNYDPSGPGRPQRIPAPRQQEQCPPPCPSCGGLECLCRPRFFAGQLLTEHDLNALQDYIVAKNRLHNRYVHGWGVVCGLEVICHPCDDVVSVRPGYALSPCGDDIVVCREETVDVCALIERCRPRRDECESPQSGRYDPCPDREEEWILAICYKETQSRGITALRGGGCGPECSCGGSGDCECGCGCGCGGGGGDKKSGRNGGGHGCGCGGGGGSSTSGKKNGHSHKSSSSRTTPAHCEPTLICEGYTFTVYKPPPRDPASDNITGKWPDMGDMFNRIMACIIELFERLPAKPTNATTAQLHAWCEDLRRIIMDFFRHHPTYDCLLDEFLKTLHCPPTAGYENNPAGYEALLNTALNDLGEVAASFLRYCFCSNMLPPCPEKVGANCVPLATVTVSQGGRGCRVIRVCNWGPRTFALTWPQMRYWLSPLQIAKRLAEMMENICCVEADFELRGEDYLRGVRHAAHGMAAAPATAASASAGGTSTASAAPPSGSAATGATTSTGSTTTTMRTPNPNLKLLAQAFARPDREVGPKTLFLGALGVRDETGKPLVSDLELHHPAHFLLANQFARPLLSGLIGDDPRDLAGAVAGMMGMGGGGTDFTGTTGFAAVSPRASAGDIDELRRTLAELQETVRRQQDEINNLRNR